MRQQALLRAHMRHRAQLTACLRHRRHIAPLPCPCSFQTFDRDRSGTLTPDEVLQALRQAGAHERRVHAIGMHACASSNLACVNLACGNLACGGVCAGFQLDQPAMLAMINKFDPDNSRSLVSVQGGREEGSCTWR